MSEKPKFFRPIAAPLDVEDAALDRVNTQLGVPTLTKPTAVKILDAASHSEPPSQIAEPERAALEKLTIEIPMYLADEIKREALNRRTTARHVVMTALRKNGFRVEDADLVPDGRRTRGKYGRL